MLTSFASLMSMMGQFLSERGANDRATVDDYLEWLRRHDHQQAVNLILNNAELSQAIKTLLEDQHGHVMAKLGQLDQTLSSVASHLADFKPIAQAMAVKSRLSDQAVSILRQMNRANASDFMELAVFGGTHYEMRDGTGENLEIADQRFIKDDLATLCGLRLLMPHTDGAGCRIFTITRAGATLGA